MGGSRSKNAASFTPWLSKGIGILSFDHRGFGESGGLAHVENPDLEGQDVIKIVDLIASLPWVAKEVPETTTVEQTRAPGRSGGKGQGAKDGHPTTVSTPSSRSTRCVADLDAFFEKNGPAWHISQGRQLDIPVLFGQGVPDNLFNLNQGLAGCPTMTAGLPSSPRCGDSRFHSTQMLWFSSGPSYFGTTC